jgi:hypothetical protein
VKREGAEVKRLRSLMVEVNPWTPPADLNTALLARGAIVSAWAQIEAMMTDVIVRASRHPEYQSLRAAFPYRRSDRWSHFKRMLEAPGPIGPYKAPALKLLARYEAGKSLRDLLAHGRMTILPYPGGAPSSVIIEMIDSVDRELIHIRKQFSPASLEAEAREVAKLARVAALGFSRVVLLLPPLHGSYLVAGSPDAEKR